MPPKISREAMYQEIIAKGELSKFVESFWEAKPDEHWLLLPPDGTFNVFFSDAPIRLQSENWQELVAGGFYLIPIQSQSIQIQSQGKLLGIRFKPFAYCNISHNKDSFLIAQSANNFCINPDSSLVRDAFSAWDSEMSLCDFLPKLQNIIVELMQGQRQLNTSLRDKVNYILDLKGAVNIGEMAQTFAISRQALHKSFVQSMGISPKELANIWQFNHFLSAIDHKQSLTITALDSGYYDQAHGINDFRRKLGFAPSVLLKSPQPSLDFAKQCIKNRFTNVYDPS